jgi:uncharacterized protein (TIGR00661 family)
MKRMSTKKNILICPLDWGLGHATRCIPMIRQLKTNHQVFIASSGGAAELLKQEYPDLKHFSLPSYKITYPTKRSMSWHMALHFPTLMATLLQEKKVVKKIIEKNNINFIISDNRFGAHSKKIPTVFITHQINIKTPQLNKWINKLNHRFIKKFTQCWIPDYEIAPGLAGELSHPSIQNIKSIYIGPQSRFQDSTQEKIFDITVVLSGPEPQRTLLEDILFEQLFLLEDKKINLIRGIYTSNENAMVKNIHVFDHLNSTELEKILHQSKNIICRSGYSGIMDLQFINAKILLIPTPQQTEQEYLAKIVSGNNKFHSQKQSEINIEEFLNAAFTNENSKEENEIDFNNLLSEI